MKNLLLLIKTTTICFIINLISIAPSYAQKDLKSLEGFYQFSENKDAFLQIKAKGDSLVLKQLWDRQEFSFGQTSPLEFYCKARSFPLKFTDSAGRITRVLAFNKDTWNKVAHYVSPASKEIQLTPQQLKTFEGTYKMNGGDADDILLITSKENRLVLNQLWDGQEITFLAQSPLDFYCPERLFPLRFTKDQNGVVTQVLAFHKDVWIKQKNNNTNH
ncbi:hypothetical protein FC093_22280 [Ilyomonas limi]|uniref:Uncharacterized protein n=1 Tax=Ilyomonas limi TaxID=2575867 RepID=A0A4U3KSG0_9BACT|nr:hypothetical protein [Ilyomonas limi]TKK64599.1 hypothetical protein FC093_22280 [Ilyomonas limi]